MIVDFHVHTTSSDGTCTPTEIVNAAAKDGFAAVAITDHDSCSGVEEFLACSSEGVVKTSGIELSVAPGINFDKFHLLGLGIDPNNGELKKALEDIVSERNARNEKMLAKVKVQFENANVDKIRTFATGTILARPHFARWLVENSHAKDIAEAFEKYLLPNSPEDTSCYEERRRISREEAIRVIHAAGGIAVMAHPKYLKREWKAVGVDFDAVRRGLEELKEMGLDGIEAMYGTNTIDENIAFTRMADSLKLLKTAGSDFHGTNKTIGLGMNVPESFIAPLLERLSA